MSKQRTDSALDTKPEAQGCGQSGACRPGPLCGREGKPGRCVCPLQTAVLEVGSGRTLHSGRLRQLEAGRKEHQ